MDSSLVEYLKKELQKEIDLRTGSLAAGNAMTYDEYKHVAGVIRGLALAIDTINDLVRRMEMSDE
jgi:hypothetical protein